MPIGPVVDLLSCPHCSAQLTMTDDERGVRCDQGHRYDLAKQGYLNLIGGAAAGQRRHGSHGRGSGAVPRRRPLRLDHGRGPPAGGSEQHDLGFWTPGRAPAGCSRRCSTPGAAPIRVCPEPTRSTPAASRWTCRRRPPDGPLGRTRGWGRGGRRVAQPAGRRRLHRPGDQQLRPAQLRRVRPGAAAGRPAAHDHADGRSPGRAAQHVRAAGDPDRQVGSAGGEAWATGSSRSPPITSSTGPAGRHNQWPMRSRWDPTPFTRARIARRRNRPTSRSRSSSGSGAAPSAVSSRFLFVWRRPVACIARPTREGYRVVSRPRRTQRGACLGVAKREDISTTRYWASP